MTDKELLQEALESIEWLRIHLERDHGCLHMKPAVSGITDWLNKTEAALCARLSQPEPAECDGGQCGIGGYCKQCPKTQPEQEPTAYLCENAVGHKYFRWKKPSSEYKPIALYTAHASPQRVWQGLTHEEHMEILTRDLTAPSRIAVAEAILKEKNNG